MMEMIIEFLGGAKINATFQDTVIETDQSVKSGGEGSAPEPYMHFLGSIGTCAGIYVLRFMEARKIPTEGVRLIQKMAWNEKGTRLEKIQIEIQVPPEFPEKYHSALVRVADQCAVKKTILDPPEFEVVTKVS